MARGVWMFAVCLLIAGLSQSNAEEQQLAPLKRSVRSAMQGLSAAMFEKVKKTVIKTCMENGHQDGDDLEKEFLDHIDACSEDAVRKVRNCLPEDKKYFPEFIQDLMKSVVTMMYDDYDIMRVDLAACAPDLARPSAQLKYLNCVKKVSKEQEDEDDIPKSKATFCKIFLPATECLVKWLESTCDDMDVAACAPNLRKTSSLMGYLNCLKKVSQEHDDGDCIPKSRAAFCKIHLPATECLNKWLDTSCDDTENLRKYKNDYYAANAKPCETKEDDNIDLAACAPSLVKTSSQMEYINCLKRVSQETEDDSGIPSSRASFCKKYLPATECFVKWVKSSCNDSENLKKFRADYYAASERPCEVKEVNTV
nr:unnamed protein product [Callosobruchus analis]